MGAEIERARELLGALTRDGVLPAEQAARHYEGWVAQAGEQPYSRYLLEQGVEAEQVRLSLRRLAVRGMPDPDHFTYERFEDLLMGQLGIEAGMLSAKLLRSVRAVQDKKAAEGKLRRLSQLLPRVGLDAGMLELLHQHLRERILLCRGCLGRYPRRDLGDVKAACPRCDAALEAEGLEPSGVLSLPEPQRKALLASSEHMLAPANTQDVATRQRASRRRRAEDEDRSPLVPVVVALTLLVVGGIVAAVLLESDGRHGVPVSQRPTPAVGEDDEGPAPNDRTSSPGDDLPGGPDLRGEDDAGSAAVTVAFAHQEDTRLLGEGRYAEMLEVWRKVEPSEGERADQVRAGKERRIQELEEMLERAERARDALKRIEAGALPAVHEREMIRSLAASPPNRPPPFGALDRALERLAKARREGRLADAQARYAEALRRKTPDEQAWARRAQAVKRARPLSGVFLDGRAIDGVRIMGLGEEGYELRTPDGKTRELTWEERPLIGLRVLQASCDSSLRVDARELLRLALLARDPVAAKGALSAMKLGDRAPDLRAILAEAPCPAPPLDLGGMTHRIVYPVRWLTPGIKPVRGTRIRPSEDGLLLSGTPCGLETKPLEVLQSMKAGCALAVSCVVAPGARWPSLTLRLAGRGSRRDYVARWSDAEWVFEVNFGSSVTRLANGPLDGREGRSARLALEDGEVVFSLDGFPVAREAVTLRCYRVALRVTADAGPLRIESLAAEGHLDAETLSRGERSFCARIEKALEVIPSGFGGGEPAFAPISAEDPQELAFASEELLGALDEAKAHLLAGRLDAASAQLLTLEREAPNLVSASYYLGYAAALGGEVAAAIEHLERALQKQPEFPEAEALLIFLQVVAARGPLVAPGEALAKERPDLATLALARAWTAYRGREPGRLATSQATVDDELALASNLALGDPLIQRAARSLRGACELEASFPYSFEGTGHVVLTRTSEEDARLTANVLDALASTLLKKLPRARDPLSPLAVYLLPRSELAAFTGAEAAAVYDPELHILLLDSVPSAKQGSEVLVRALSAATVRRRYGTPPPWLEVALVEHLTDLMFEGAPDGLSEIIKSDGRWDAARWEELMALDRRAVSTNRLARARCWALLRTQGVRTFQKELAQTVRRQRRIRPSLKIEKVEKEIAALVKKLGE